MNGFLVFTTLQEQRIRQALLKHQIKPGPAQADPEVPLSPEKARRPDRVIRRFRCACGRHRRKGDAQCGRCQSLGRRMGRQVERGDAPLSWQHGTIYGYQKKRCRCEPCQVAYAESRTEEIRRRREMKQAMRVAQLMTRIHAIQGPEGATHDVPA